MTTLNVSLTPALKAELGFAGIFAYAVYFDSAGQNPQWTDIVVNGAVQASGTVAINLPSAAYGQKIYFIVQSQDGSDLNVKTFTKESDIGWSNATAYDFRYDSIELFLNNTVYDVGNLTSIENFGLPMGLSVPYSDGTTATLGYGITGSALANAIDNINTSNTYTYDYASGPLKGQFRTAVSPTASVPPDTKVPDPPFHASDWATYVGHLEGSDAEKIVLSGVFLGTTDKQNVWHDGGYFAYQLHWDSTNTVFWLDPLAGSQIKGSIRLTPSDLEDSIYSTLGNAGIYSGHADPNPMTMNTGDNNQWGTVLRDFLTGFTAGFYGTSGQSPNGQVATSIDLNQNLNWDPSYAFGQNLAATPPAWQTSDAYSKIFYTYTNSYGSNYSDALMKGYAVGGPQVSLHQPNSPTDVPQINLTLYSDTEPPAGYTIPKDYNYIAPAAGAYAVPTSSAQGTNVALDFAVGVANNAGVVLAATATITLKILTSDAASTPTWSTVTFDGSSASAGAFGLWQNWTLQYNSGTNSYTAAPSSPAVGQPAGTILINGFPTSDSGVSWYQIGVGGKLFNLYTTTLGGKFENPKFAGQQGALAVDGLAKISPQNSTAQTITTFSVDFANEDTVTYDPSLLVRNTAKVATLAPAGAPVAGTLAGTVFTAVTGQSSSVSNTITTSSHHLAFAWTGQNNDPNTPSWISGPTNKIDALDVALVTIRPAGGTAVTTTATADIDGRWQTAGVDLADGTYTVTVAEYLATDTKFTTPLTPQSNLLTLTEVPQAQADFLGTGTSDILFRDPAGGALSQFVMRNGQPSWTGVGWADPGLQIVGIGDFTGDGTSDIVFRDPIGGGLGGFRMINGQPSWTSIGWADPGLQAVGIGDFNGDGSSDILFRDPASGALGNFLMSNGRPTWAGIGWADPGLRVAGVGDFNGDGTSDILFRDPVGGGLGMFAMHNDQPTWRSIGWAAPGLQVAGVGDFNGDGTSDILFRDPTSGNLGDFIMGNGGPRWANIGWADPGLQVAGVGDFNGDGTSDILFRDPVGGGIGEFSMHGNQPTWSFIGWAAPGLHVSQ